MLAAICNPHKQQIINILRNLNRILSALDLLDGCVNGLVVFQLDDDGWRINILTRNEYQVSEVLACGQFAVDDVVVGSLIVGDAQ